MPARDIYHDAVKNALIKEGWSIADDPKNQIVLAFHPPEIRPHTEFAVS